jgi:branched-chain amino acid transport system substrate-binding protein
MKTSRRGFLGGVSTAAIVSASGAALAQKKYDEGSSDTEIKIGNTNPYGPPRPTLPSARRSTPFQSVSDAGGISGPR